MNTVSVVHREPESLTTVPGTVTDLTAAVTTNSAYVLLSTDTAPVDDSGFPLLYEVTRDLTASLGSPEVIVEWASDSIDGLGVYPVSVVELSGDPNDYTYYMRWKDYAGNEGDLSNGAAP